MEPIAAAATGRECAALLRGLDLASQLRTAVSSGDDVRIGRLLTELLRVKGLTKGQRVRLQQRALSGLVESLRAAALNDELTGLCNRRGFMQSAMRLLDLAARDGHCARLFHFSLDCAGRSVAQLDSVTLRQLGNYLRDLFPNYGVYEVLGRLEATAFAALTLDVNDAARGSIALKAFAGLQREQVPPLRIGVAHFHPARPVALDELLQQATVDATAARVGASSSSAAPRFAPHGEVALC
jgi:GGDEF domain-containing protein